MKPVTERGLQLAEGDLVMAAYARRRRMYDQCVSHCRQALEKLLKAIWEEKQDFGSPPKTHNLGALAKQLLPDLDDATSEFLQRLARQYLPARNAEYEYSVEEAADYHRRTREIFSWLRRQLT